MLLKMPTSIVLELRENLIFLDDKLLSYTQNVQIEAMEIWSKLFCSAAPTSELCPMIFFYIIICTPVGTRRIAMMTEKTRIWYQS